MSLPRAAVLAALCLGATYDPPANRDPSAYVAMSVWVDPALPPWYHALAADEVARVRALGPWLVLTARREDADARISAGSFPGCPVQVRASAADREVTLDPACAPGERAWRHAVAHGLGHALGIAKHLCVGGPDCSAWCMGPGVMARGAEPEGWPDGFAESFPAGGPAVVTEADVCLYDESRGWR